MLDPAHIAPSRSDANSNGHFPPANGHMQTGTPRGFNLNHFQIAGMPPVPGAGAAAFLPFFQGVPGAAGWPGAPGDDRSSVGPIRRGGGGARFNNARSGPYDRRPRDPRFAGESGRLSPPSGGGRGGRMGGGGGGRWGDGAAGGAAVGPREAVQGRSLKSYEDLDAVAGAGGGELNY